MKLSTLGEFQKRIKILLKFYTNLDKFSNIFFYIQYFQLLGVICDELKVQCKEGL